MISPYGLFAVYILGLLAIAVFVGLFVVKSVLKKRGVIARSLNMTLLAVRLPPVHLEPMQQGTQQIRERIALMEQLYANFYEIKDSSIRNFLYGKPVFALELTIPHIGEEMAFYVAVPRRVSGTVEKVIQGIFPDAHVEPAKDYNIFNPEGASSGGYMRLGRNRYYPARSYQKLEGDPMREVTNVFTKLAAAGEEIGRAHV